MISSVHALEEAGFRTMDAHITLVFEHSKQSILDYKDSCTIRDYKASDENKLIGIARDAFTKTPDRFHADPNLPADRKNEVYAEWIRNSCSGQLADYVVVAELNGEPVGYATAKFHGDHGGLSNTKTGTLVVGAVAPSAQRKGIIISLEIACLKWLNAKNTDVSCVGTQVNNYAVQRTFVRLGFRPAMAGVHMHIWTGTINSARRHASSCI
jgi:GNAT superfamily N-acetyltransferase